MNKYPKGLFFLVFTEFWERFGYYLMIGIFMLYMTSDTKEGGWGWDNAKGADIFGTFIAMAYLTPFIGGLLADLKLGYRFCITIGGILMGIGYCVLSIKTETAFYSALVIMVVGNGFFKPNISTLLGNLYSTPEFKDKKDTGYNIFYMGINAGAFICNIIAAFMRNKYGWGGAFITAGIGMFTGVVIFWMGNKHYKHLDVRRVSKVEDKPLMNKFYSVLLIAIGFAMLGLKLPQWINGTDATFFGSKSSDAFFFAVIPIVYFYASIFIKANKEEKRPLGTMFTIFFIVIIFWAIFKQNGTALTTYAESYTNREVPTAMVNITQTLSQSKKIYAKNDTVFQLDEQFRKIKDANGKPIRCIDYPAYFKNLPADKYPKNGEGLTLFNTELFQSINPFFVITLTPILILIFAYLRKRKREPTTASKIALGLFISALSTLTMVWAVNHTENGIHKASALWLFFGYGVITVGELCLSPMGLSMVSKLSPVRLTALMMGGWSLATSIGNKLSGVLAKNWDKFDNKANYYWLNFALLMLAFLIMLLLLKRLNRVFKEE